MQLRLATLDDADFLLRLRNDAGTRAQSLHEDVVDAANHQAYLTSHIDAENVRLYIALDGDIAVGTCRSELGNDESELSWTIAPEQRGRGYGGHMLTALLAITPGPVIAVIKDGNLASRRMVEHASFTRVSDRDGLCTYRLADRSERR